MKRLPFVALVMLIPILTACETTRVLRQGNALAETGKAYSDAMMPLADLVLTERIERKSNRLADERKNLTTENLLKFPQAAYKPFVATCNGDRSLDSPAKQRSCIDGLILDKATEEMQAYQILLEIYKAHTRKLAEYFVALNAFMDTDAKTLGQTAIQEAATGLQSLGNSLESKFKISAGQITGLQSLGGVAFSEMHGREAKKILDSQVNMIGRELAIQNAVLQQFENLLAQERKRDKLSIENFVVRPAFQAGTDTTPRPALPGDWVIKWTAVVTDHSAIETLKTAQSASKNAVKAWKAYVEGRPDFKDLLDDINLTKGGVAALKKIHESR